MKTLASFREMASKIGAKTHLKAARMNTGVKDTTQEVFLEKLIDSYKSAQGPAAKQAMLDEAFKNLPDDITSPVWRLDGALIPIC